MLITAYWQHERCLSASSKSGLVHEWRGREDIHVASRSTRLVKSDVDYILGHSGAKLVLVDHEYAGLVKDCPVPVIISRDTGRAGDPYEAFLSAGRDFSRERGWAGLQLEEDETANATLNYTCVSLSLQNACDL